jgi:hypothetical protein
LRPGLGRATGGEMAEHTVIFEFLTIGNSVKVTAFDTESLVEVSIVGPAGAPQAHLRAAAVSKLNYVLAQMKKRDEGEIV